MAIRGWRLPIEVVSEFMGHSLRLAYLDNDEQGMLNDIGEFQLRESSAPGDIRIALQRYPDLGRLYNSEHAGEVGLPLDSAELLSNPTSKCSVLKRYHP